VYEHHARLAADQMFLRALEIATYDEGVLDQGVLQIRPGSDNAEFLDFYKTLDDNSVYELILRHPESGRSRRILQDIRGRRLLKRACEFTPKNLEDRADVSDDLMKKGPAI